MFLKWMKENNFRDVNFDTPLIPKACDRDFWDKRNNAQLIERAEKYIDFSWPSIPVSTFIAFQREGNRMKHEIPYFERRKALTSLVIGEILEHKGRFLPQIVNGIYVICEETYWGLSAHIKFCDQTPLIPSPEFPNIDLFAAETAATLALTYHLLYEEIKDYCSPILERIEYELNNKTIKPYLNLKKFFWMGYHGKPVNNWNPWIISNLLTVFLIIKKDEDFYAGLEKMFTEINNYYVSALDDGGCDEGASYWVKAGGMLFNFCDNLYIATNGRINFFNDEKIKRISEYIPNTYIGNGYITNFADGSVKVTRGIESLIYRFGKRTSNKRLCAFAGLIKQNETIESSDLYTMLCDVIYKNEISDTEKYNPLDEYIYPKLQVSFANTDNWFYAAKGGHNSESHNHNDIGSFIGYYNNSPVLIDPGCGTYTKQTFSEERYKIWTMQSGWHNLPVVNKLEQYNGEEYKATSFTLKNKTTNISFADAYPKEAKIMNLNRSIIQKNTGIEITDKFEFENLNNTVEEHFITALTTFVKENRVYIGDEYILETNKDAEIVLDNVDFDGDKKLIKMWNSDGLNRISFNFKTEKESEITFTLRRL